MKKIEHINHKINLNVNNKIKDIKLMMKKLPKVKLFAYMCNG